MTTLTLPRLRGSTFARYSVSELNLDRLRELAGHLRNACRELRELAAQGADAFVADSKTRNRPSTFSSSRLKRHWTCATIWQQKKGGRSPEDYADCMSILA